MEPDEQFAVPAPPDLEEMARMRAEQAAIAAVQDAALAAVRAECDAEREASR